MQTTFEDNFITSADMLEETDLNSPIKDFLKDKSVFITGGFGFVGKLLIEKLLRCDVEKIYLLVRAKRGKSLVERFEKLMKEPVSQHEWKVESFIVEMSFPPDFHETVEREGKSFLENRFGQR